MVSHKCVMCKKEINVDYFKDYEFDDDGEMWCASCFEQESDTGEVY
ncbi:hypothetical protein [Paucisalibacillus globulus]|nr:hypothetical protein [Paucisalibacillus globulus]